MPTHTVARAGWRRGLIDLRIQVRTPKELFGHLSLPLVFGILFLVKDNGAGAADALLAGAIAMAVFSTGLMSVSQWLALDQEDGTILRLRGIPGGIPAYLLGKLAVVVAISLAHFLLLTAIAEVASDARLPQGWLTLCWLLPLGLVAMTSLGAAIGALVPNPRAWSLVMLPAMGLLGVSGIFFPMSSLARPVQALADVFPLAWLARGLRYAYLPDSPEFAGGSPLLPAFGVLCAWAAVGVLLAPPLLRRLTRLQSGSRLQAAQLKAAGARR